MSDRAYLATRKGLFELYRTDQAWHLGAQHFLGDPVSMLLADRRDGTLYAALHLGHFGPKLHRRKAGSDQWSEVAVPAFPVKPADSADPVEWKVLQIWSLAAGGPDQPGVLWAGTLPGGLFRSEDYGDSWQLVEALWQVPERAQWMGGGYDVPGIHSICVDPRDSNAVLVGISCGGAWLTTDGGASWQMRAEGMRATYMPPELAGVQAVQDPHRIVRCAAEPDKLWCQHHNGIWRSVDNGAHWQEIQPQQVSNFGFVTAVHPQDGETAWFVPASADSQRIPPQAALAVTRTSDGGHSFTAWRGGLPQQHCYDLVYRHGLDVSADGRVLLMGSTTGGVWVSEDGGGQWQTIAAHLPPVYAVSFG
ncbi:WD40/YVTN/BNR-like repeat-containing protein [Duganella qianjiadongensis]|uniref:Exo-alpha-sialidase n=1 Tax=Duganella qianjiadongensis TaxID=2692176 RepID=A0ABW9VPP2_9BURK|nr:exo-alpha-sialidase [Duganella qianjiadongensis]MYM40687.1 exo-alpha-sialidase [Duganella qianjiadongensis]